MIVRSFGCLLFLWLACPGGYAGAGGWPGSSDSVLADRVRTLRIPALAEDDELVGLPVFVDEVKARVYVPVASRDGSQASTGFKHVFLFNSDGLGLELRPELKYGETAGGRSVQVEVWSSDLLPPGEYTPYICWSTGGAVRVSRLTTQSLSQPNVDDFITRLGAQILDDERLLAYVRSSGNMRLTSAVERILAVFKTARDPELAEACLVALGKIGVPKDFISEVGNEGDSTSDDLIEKLHKAFAPDASVADLAAVGALANKQVSALAMLRLAYRGEKEAALSVPLEGSWDRMVRFRLSVGALADHRKQEMK